MARGFTAAIVPLAFVAVFCLHSRLQQNFACRFVLSWCQAPNGSSSVDVEKLWHFWHSN
jgi:hypothetical protein